MEERVRQLEQQVRDLLAWISERNFQQIRYPLDEASRNTLAEEFTQVEDLGDGSTPLTQTINLSGNAETITVPRAYADTVLLKVGDTTYEIPYL
jgi:hypothetical protein